MVGNFRNAGKNDDRDNGLTQRIMHEYLTETGKAGATKTHLMRAAVIASPGKVMITEVPLRDPGEDEVRIRITGCGLCASSMPLWEGREWFKYPAEAGSPGHEGWGVIDAVGEHVEGFASGDPVAVISNHAFAQYDITSASQVVKIPVALKDMPFPGEPLACAVNIFSRSGIKEGDTVAIIGIGFLGAILVQLAKNAGARVIAISRSETSLRLAHQFKADEIIPMKDHWKIIDQVKKITEGRLCGKVIEATGKQWPLDLAAELTAVRGRLIVAGYHQDGPRKVNMQLWNWKGLDVINAHERDPDIYVEGLKEAMGAVSSGKIDPLPLYRHFPFEEINTAFSMQREKPEGFVKAIIDLK